MNSLVELAEVQQSISLKNIALATDFSEASDKAFEYATAIAGCYQSKLHVVHAIPAAPSLLPTLFEHDQLEQQSEQRMYDLSTRSELKALTHQLLVRTGSVWTVLSHVIHDEKIDLLVLGTHGWGGFKKAVLGSVAEEIVRLSPCAVMTIGPNTIAPPDFDGEFHRILFATSFGTASEKALPYALFFAKPSRAKLILLHVLPPTPYPTPGVGLKAHERIQEWRDEQTAVIKAKLEELLPSGEVLECEPEYVVGFDLLFQGILSAATEHQPDLIVMGAKRALSSKTIAHMPWTVMHEVMCHAKCPVLTVRA